MLGAVTIGAAQGRISTGPFGAPDNAGVNRRTVGQLEAGILRIIGDNIVLLEITQELVIRNCRLRQEPEVHAERDTSWWCSCRFSLNAGWCRRPW